VILSATDRLDILDVITRADEAASRRDADAYVALFTEDAVLDGAQGRHAGRQALLASQTRGKAVERARSAPAPPAYVRADRCDRSPGWCVAGSSSGVSVSEGH
jgi:SnoaL-like domain